MVKTVNKYFCMRCGHHFKRLDKFKEHTIYRSEPSTKCPNRFPDIDWTTCCTDAENQLKHYKTKKKFLYNESPTADQAAKLLTKAANIHPIMRYNWDKAFYRTVIEQFLDRKRAAGYDVVTVQRGYHVWERKEYTYLVKDGIIYTPYSKNRNLIQCGVVEYAYFSPKDIRIKDTDGIEYYNRYKKYASTNSDPFKADDAAVYNYYKIDESSVVHIDEHDRVYVDPGEHIESEALCYKIEADSTVFFPNTDKRADYGVTGNYFNVTFNRNSKQFVEHEKPIAKLVSDCTYNRSHFRVVMKALHVEKGLTKAEDDDTYDGQETKQQ